MSVIPGAIVLDGVDYPVVERFDIEDGLPYNWKPYAEKVEPVVINQPEISGSSRPARSARPDEFEWRIDDWSGGEGFRHLDSADDLSFRRYWYSDLGGVDVRTRGQLSLGFLLADEDDLGGTNRSQGPYLVHRTGGAVGQRVEAYVDDRVFSNTAAAPGTWVDRAQSSVAAGNRISGPPRAHGGYVFAAFKDGTGGANSSNVRRIDGGFVGTNYIAAGSAATAGSNQENALVGDNALFVMKDDSGKLVLNRTVSSLTTNPNTLSTVYTVHNVGAEAGIDNLGKHFYIASQFGAEEEVRIHFYPNGGSGVERVRLPVGFRMNTTPYDSLQFLGDILFAGGYREGTTGYPQRGMLVYVSGARSGTVGIIRDDTDVDTSADRIQALHQGFRNQLLLGTIQGKVYVYDIANGGISHLMSGVPATEQITSLDYYLGLYYAATREAQSGTSDGVHVYHTVPTGANRYPAQGRVIGSTWDFNYPEVKKLITELILQTKALPANTKVTLRLVLDDDTIITTDKDGAALEFTTTGSKTKVFRMSGVTGSTSVSRTCKVARVDIQLDSSSVDQSTTPTVYAVTVRALPREFVHFFEATVSLADNPPGEIALPYPQSGFERQTSLRALRDNQPAKPVLFRPRYRSGDGYMIPEQESTSYEVMIDDCEFFLSRKGSGYARVLLRRIDGPA